MSLAGSSQEWGLRSPGAALPTLDVLPGLSSANGYVCIEVRAPAHLLHKPEQGSCIYRAWIRPRHRDHAEAAIATAMFINKAVPSTVSITLHPRPMRRQGRGWLQEVTAVALRVEPGASMEAAEGLNQLQRLATPATVWGAPPEGPAYMSFALAEAVPPEAATEVVQRLRTVLGLPGSSPDDPMVLLPGSLFWTEDGRTAEVQVVTHDPTATTTIRMLAAAAEELGQGPARDGGAGTGGQEEAGGGQEADAEDVGEEVRPPRGRRPSASPEPWSAEQVELLDQVLPEHVTDYMLYGFHKDNGHYHTPAAADLAVVRYLVSAGFTDGQVLYPFERNHRRLAFNAAGMDPDYLHRLIATVRADGADQSRAVVRYADGSSDPRRIYLSLHIVSGPHEGKEFNQGVSLGSSVQPWIFRAAGFHPPLVAALDHYRQLAGRTVAVELAEEDGRVIVKKWLAAPALEPLPVGPEEQAAPPQQPSLFEAPPPVTFPLVEAPPAPEEWRPRLDAALDRLEATGIAVDPVRWRLATQRALWAWLSAWVATGDEVERRRILAKMRTLANLASEVWWQAALLGRARCRWEGHHAWSGRLHGHQPPLQQLARKLRWAIVAPPGKVLVIADWSCAQARILAALSGDQRLIAALSMEGRDPYLELGRWVLAMLQERRALPPGGDADGGDAVPDARGVGKALFLPALFFAGEDELGPKVAPLGLTLSSSDARAIHGYLREQYPRLVQWREVQRATSRFLSPLGRICTLPTTKYKNGKPKLPSVVAGVAQAHESDALRLVLSWSEQHLAGTGAEVVMVNHDEVVFEVDEAQAKEAAAVARKLMEAALGLVCNVAAPGAHCPPKVDVEVRQAWGHEDDGDGRLEDDDVA